MADEIIITGRDATSVIVDTSGVDTIVADTVYIQGVPGNGSGGGGGSVESVAGRTGDVVLSSADLTDAALLATYAELSSGLATKANSTHTHAPADITGTAVITTDPRLSDARTPTTHSHPTSDINDSTATGRSVLTAADATAARTAINAGTSNLAIGTTDTTAAAGNRQATQTAIGMVELATTAEATTGTDTTRAVTPVGLKAVADTKANSNHTHTSADISDLTESVQDVVGSMVSAAGGTYDDAAGTVTLPSGSSSFPIQYVALTSNHTQTTTGWPTDQPVAVVYTQDATGSRTVTYNGQPITIKTQPGSETMVIYTPIGSTWWPKVIEGIGADGTPVGPVSVTASAPTWTDDIINGGGTWTNATTTGVTYAPASGTANPGQVVTVTATAQSGYTLTGTTSWNHTFPNAPSAVSVTDSFNRADNATSLGTTETGGKTWEIAGGSTWGITGNKAGMLVGTAIRGHANVDLGATNMAVEARMNVLGRAGSYPSIVGRYVDPTNCYMLQNSDAAGENKTILVRIGGVNTFLATSLSIPNNGLLKLTLVEEGSDTRVKVYADGVEVWSGLATIANRPNGTKAGLFAYTADSSARFDDFKAESL